MINLDGEEWGVAKMVKHDKRGFTLVELAIALAAAGSISVVSMQDEKVEQRQDNAVDMATEIHAFNQGVRRYMADHLDTPSSATGVFTGADWLRSTPCNAFDYLSCDVLKSNTTKYYHSEPEISVSTDGDGGLIADIRWTPVVGENGNVDSMVMGTTALSVSGMYLMGEEKPSTVSSMTVFCADSGNSPFDMCSGNENRIVSRLSVKGELAALSGQPWLRADRDMDGGNVMEHVIEFSEPGSILSDADISSVDNNGMRQIINVARLYNNGGAGDESLVLGKSSGSGIYSSAFLASKNLLRNAIVVDGDVGVMESLYVRGKMAVQGDLSAQGDISSLGDIQTSENIAAGEDIVAGMNISAGQRITAGQDVVSGRDINAGRAVKGRYVTASRDILAGNEVSSQGSLNIDGASELIGDSLMESDLVVDDNLLAGSNVRIEGNTIVDSYIRTNSYLQGDHLRISGRVSEGGSCSTGSSSRMNDGRLLNCVGGRWRLAGTSATSCSRNAVRGVVKGNKLCKQFCSHDQSKWVEAMCFKGPDLVVKMIWGSRYGCGTCTVVVDLKCISGCDGANLRNSYMRRSGSTSYHMWNGIYMGAVSGTVHRRCFDCYGLSRAMVKTYVVPFKYAHNYQRVGSWYNHRWR